MNNKAITIFSASITSMFGLICLVWWFTYDPTMNFAESLPGMDGAPSSIETAANAETVNIGAFYEKYDSVAVALPGKWQQFRGANFDNISTERNALADKWPAGGPEIIWSHDLGEGHAAPAVMNGRVYLLDYDEENRFDVLRCFSFETGKELWRRWYHVKVKRNHGFSRTVPAVTEKYVITIGPRCHVMCVDAITGDFHWGLDLEKDYGTETPFWYTGQCPLIDDSVAVIAPSGTVLMMGVSCATGKIIWETPNEQGWKMSHVSVMPMTLNNKKMYVYSAIGGMAGVSAAGDDVGKILWETTLWDHSVLAPSPVIAEDGKIFLTAGYGAGSMVLKITVENGGYTVTKLQEYTPKDGLASEQQTAILYKDHLFGIQPKDAGALRTQFVCYHPDDCTKLVWSSGQTNRFGLGPYIIADKKIFILDDDGTLTLIEASTKEYKQLAQAKVLEGHDAWGPLALTNGRLLLRDSKRMVCIDVRKNKNKESHAKTPRR